MRSMLTGVVAVRVRVFLVFFYQRDAGGGNYHISSIQPGSSVLILGDVLYIEAT